MRLLGHSFDDDFFLYTFTELFQGDVAPLLSTTKKTAYMLRTNLAMSTVSHLVTLQMTVSLS